MTDLVAGVAAGVPYLLRQPDTARPDAPAVVAWHLLDAPRTPEAFAAALPLDGFDGWRVYLGMPMFGSRAIDPEDAAARIRRDAILQIHDPINRQAVAEFPDAWSAIHAEHGVGDGPVGLLGGSAGGAVAGAVALGGSVSARALVLVNPLLQLRAVVPLLEALAGAPYTWSAGSEAAADRMDLVARAREFDDLPVRLVVGAEDDPDAMLRPARELEAALPSAELVSVSGMAHALAEEPGTDAAPQTAHAAEVDRLAVEWLWRHL